MTWDNPILPLLLAFVIISGILIPLLIVLVSYTRMKKKEKIMKRKIRKKGKLNHTNKKKKKK